MRPAALASGGLALAILGCAGPPYFESDDFWTVRSAHRTVLTREMASPQPYAPLPAPPEGVQQIQYRSGELELTGWYVPPPPESPCPRALVVYLHGGFAFGPEDLYVVGPLYSAGFGVLAPILRAENGGPGHHERFYGELDDALAAVRWASGRPEVDPGRIVTYGHSAGGVLSALISLVPDVPVAWTASAGGMYDESHFAKSLELPFDPSDRLERRLRVFPHWAKRSMRRRHLAWVGTEDPIVLETAARLESAGVNGPLELRRAPGDHSESLRPATEDLAKELLGWCAGK